MINLISTPEDFATLYPDAETDMYDVLYQALVRARQLHGNEGVLAIKQRKPNEYLAYAGRFGGSGDQTDHDDALAVSTSRTKLIDAYPLYPQSSQNIHLNPKTEQITPYSIIPEDEVAVQEIFVLVDDDFTLPHDTFISIELGESNLSMYQEKTNYKLPVSVSDGIYRCLRPGLNMYHTEISTGDTVLASSTIPLQPVEENPTHETPQHAYHEWVVKTITQERVTLQRNDHLVEIDRSDFISYIFESFAIIPPTRSEQELTPNSNPLR